MLHEQLDQVVGWWPSAPITIHLASSTRIGKRSSVWSLIDQITLDYRLARRNRLDRIGAGVAIHTAAGVRPFEGMPQDCIDLSDYVLPVVEL